MSWGPIFAHTRVLASILQTNVPSLLSSDRGVRDGNLASRALLDPRWTATPALLIVRNAIVTTAAEAAYAKLEADLEAWDCLFRSPIRLHCARGQAPPLFWLVFTGAVDLHGSEFADLVFRNIRRRDAQLAPRPVIVAGPSSRSPWRSLAAC